MNENTSVPSAPTSSPSSSPSPGQPRDEAALALTSTVATSARDLTDEAKQVAGDVMDQAKKSAETSITSGKERAAESLADVADALRQAGEHLRSQDKASLTDYVVRAADKVEAASFYLQRRTLSDVLGDVGGLARREPALFLGGAFALGLLGGRFLKSSGSRTAEKPESGESDSKPVADAGGQDESSTSAQNRDRGKEGRSRGQRRGSSGGGTSEEKRGNGGTAAKAPGAM